MRKLWTLLLSVFMITTFTACGGTTGASADKKASNSTPASSESKQTASNTSKTLVVYFSCSGNTKKLAQTAATALNADIYEIVPKKPYTDNDLNYNDESTRATVEQKDDKARPALKDKNANIAAYDKIVIAYPIWWGQAPRIVDTFLESYDFSGKTIAPICTSGGSDVGSSADYLKSITRGSANWKPGKKFSPSASAQELKSLFD